MDWLIGHLIGDYLLQNDWMAQGKKKSSLVCVVHCALYAFAVWLCTSWPLAVIALIFALHFAQDRGSLIRKWMSLVGQDQFAGPPLGPWSIIVVDNVWHLVSLYVIHRYLAGNPFSGVIP